MFPCHAVASSTPEPPGPLPVSLHFHIAGPTGFNQKNDLRSARTEGTWQRYFRTSHLFDPPSCLGLDRDLRVLQTSSLYGVPPTSMCLALHIVALASCVGHRCQSTLTIVSTFVGCLKIPPLDLWIRCRSSPSGPWVPFPFGSLDLRPSELLRTRGLSPPVLSGPLADPGPPCVGRVRRSRWSRHLPGEGLLGPWAQFSSWAPTFCISTAPVLLRVDPD